MRDDRRARSRRRGRRPSAGFRPEQRTRAVALAGFIALDATEADRAEYRDDIETLRRVTREGLPGAPSGTTWVYLHQAVLGFDGDDVWGRSLDRVNDGEADAVCPECDDELLLELTSDNPLITPGLSSPLAVRLHDEAVGAGHDAVATTLTHLFGQVTCPGCDATFDLADHVV